MRSALTLLLAFTLLCTAALADDEGTFGPELEFTNRKLWAEDYSGGNDHAADVNIAARDQWAKYMTAVCVRRKNCYVEAVEGSYFYKGKEVQGIKSYRVQYDDGFWYMISLDPGIIEVQMKLTPTEARHWRSRIQEDVFEAAKVSANLHPNKYESHLHEGVLSNFGRDMRLLRNHAVDTMNHQEPAFLFTPDGFENAPPLSVLPKKDAFDKFAEVVRAVDDGRIKDPEDFGEQIRNKVYTVTLNKEYGDADGPTKYQYYNVNRLKRGTPPEDMTVELRAIPNPQSA